MVSEELIKAIPRQMLLSASLIRKDYIAHDKLAITLKYSTDADVRRFGERLDSLREARVDADYKLGISISKDRAADEYLNATDLRDELQRYGVPRLAKAVKAQLQPVHGAPAPPGPKPTAAPPPANP
jgi:hypothetical protein